MFGWRRRKILARLRAAWGQPVGAGRPVDDRVAEAWDELERAGAPAGALDARTWADLDLDRVLAGIDRTETGLGRQVLHRRVRSGAAWDDTPGQEILAERFRTDPALRESVGFHLASAGPTLGFGFWMITRPGAIVTQWWYRAFPVLSIGMLASIVAIPFVPRILPVVLVLAVVNLVIRMATAWQVPGILAPMRQMGPVIHTAERLLEVIGTGDDQLLTMAEKVRRLQPLRRIASWVSRDVMASGDLVTAAWEYFNLLFILDANALFLSARHLEELGPVLAAVAGWIGDVDVALSVAALRAEPRGWCVPAWRDQPETRGAGLWHPLVDDPVPNDVTLRPGRGIIITGANMSGKSTYLRTVGVAAVLARALGTCPAQSWQGRPYRVRSLIGRNDDLALGKSYYQVEADGVVGMLHDAAAPTPTLFLLDELLRGTNTVERLAAGEAVLRALLAGPEGGAAHVVLVATHDGELVSMLSGLYQPFHFRETAGPEGLSFDYQRREGPASTRTAIALLESTGAPKSVVDAARARAEELDRARG